MGTRQTTIDHLLDVLASAGPVRARKMFGEYCLYLADKPIALVCDDQLFIKPTDAGRALLSHADEAPPYPGGKPYLRITPDQWDERDWLVQLVRTTAQALPEPAPRQPTQARSSKLTQA